MAELLGDGRGGSLDVFLREAVAIVEGDQFAIWRIHTFQQIEHNFVGRRAGAHQFAVVQPDDLTFDHRHTVNLHRACGRRHLTRLHFADTPLHRIGHPVEIAIWVEGQHGGDTLRHGARRDHLYCLDRVIGGLLSGELNVLVVRQDDNFVGRQVFEGRHDVCRTGVHRLPTGHKDDGLRAEYFVEAGAGRDHHRHNLPLGHVHFGLAPCPAPRQRFVHLRQQVFHVDVDHRAERLGQVYRLLTLLFRKVNVHAVNVVPRTHLDRRADLLQSIIETPEFDLLLRAEVHHHFPLLPRLHGFHRRAHLGEIERLDLGLGRSVHRDAKRISQHALQQNGQPLPAGVHNARLFEHREKFGCFGDRFPTATNNLIENVDQVVAVGGGHFSSDGSILRDSEDRTFHRLDHTAIGCVGRLAHGAGQVGGVELLLVADAAREPAKNLRKDDAAVAARSH